MSFSLADAFLFRETRGLAGGCVVLVLKFVRINRGLSQSDLSYRVLMRQSHISAIENRRINPTPKELAALAVALDVADPAVLLDEVPNPIAEPAESRA